MKTIREFENLHIALWLLKDACWIMNYRTAGMIMITPTLLMALYISWRTRKNIHEVMHNIAVTLWICANGIWMTGEFYFHDTTRQYSIVFFALGLAVISYYYAFIFPKKWKEQADGTIENENAPV